MRYSAESPWESLPAELAPRLRPELPRLASLMVTEIQRRIPEFARPLDGPYGRNIRLGVERALTEFADRLAEGRGPQRDPGSGDAEVYRELGRGEVHEGRSLDALQAAYRLGARIGWQCLVEVGERAGIPPARMYRVAEAVFAYIDELADHTLEGYTEAQASLAGELQRRRQRLLDVLTGTPAPTREAAAKLAHSARWPLPDTVRVVALRPAGRRGEESPTPVLPGVDALVDADGHQPYMLLADPGPGARALLDRALRGRSAAVGPAVPLTDAGTSLRWARRLLALGARGLGGPGGPGIRDLGGTGGGRVLHCADHLPALVLLEDETLIRTLAARRLAPLNALTPRQRDRLAGTLLAWLECGGSAPEVARVLRVHPQTVRYRVRQIEELFGGGLHDPDARFELELALRARQLLDGLAPRVDGRPSRRRPGRRAGGPEKPVNGYGAAAR